MSLLGAAAPSRAIVAHGLTLADWIGAGAILVVAAVGGRLLQSLIERAIGKGDTERRTAEAFARTVGYAVMAAGLVWALSILGVRLGLLFGALGISGLAIAFAAQSILANFLASIILRCRRPFRRGDQIETNDCEGTVEGVNFRTVALRTFEGQRVMVPCAEVLSKPILNHTTLGRRRTTLPVGVAYDADLARTQALLVEAVQGTDGVLERPAAEVWVEGFGASSVKMAVRFWHAPDMATMWRVRSAVAVAVKQTLDAAAVEMPYPQRTVHFATEPTEPFEPAEPADRADESPSRAEPDGHRAMRTNGSSNGGSARPEHRSS